MKLWPVITGMCIFLLAPVTHANNKNYPCSGAMGSYYTNPDGTPGGFVANSATVDTSVTIGVEASEVPQV